MAEAEKRSLVRPILRYTFAIVLVIAALLLRLMLEQYFNIKLPAFITFYPVIIVIALLMGLWQGLLATALSAALVNYWIFPSLEWSGNNRTSNVISLFLLAGMGVFISVVAERFRYDQQRIAALERTQALRETEEQLEKLAASQKLAIDAADLGTWDYRLDTGDVFWDERCRNGFGFTKGDHLNYEGVLSHIHPEDRPVIDDAVNQAIAGVDDGAYSQEFRVLWPDGSQHWIASYGRVSFRGEGSQRKAIRFLGINRDITERNNSKEALHASEERNRMVAETMLQGVVHQDEHGTIIAMNPAAERILGWTHKQYPGMTSTQLDNTTIQEDGSPFPGDEHPAMVALRTGKPVAGVIMGIWNSQFRDYRWINVTAVPLFRQNQSTPHQVYTIFEDITERKWTESVLQNTLQRFYAILSNMNAGILLVTDEGRIEFVNQSFCDLFSLTDSPANLMGLDSASMIESITCAYREPDHAYPRIRELLHHGIPVLNEEVAMQNGNTFLRDFVPLKLDGRSYGRLWVHTDISERKRTEEALRNSERLYRAIGESINYGVWVCAPDGRNLYASESFLKLVGITQQQCSDFGWGDILHPDDAERTIAAWKECVSTEGVWDIEHRFRGVDGAWHPILARGLPVRDDHGKVINWVGINLDISNLKKAEAALLRSEKLASVGRMAAAISHEINNPLEAVTNLIYLTREMKDLPKSALEYLEMADTELTRVAHITRQSLGFYRESMAPACTSISEVLESAVHLLNGKINTKQAIIQKEWDDDIKITAVAGELRQVFCNLLGNSLDAIDTGGTIQLRISKGQDFKDGRSTVRVTVADNGQGIPANLQQHIFEPFFTTKGSVGTGLGLWIAQQLTDKHHGRIQVHSSTQASNRGTVFSVVLPCEQREKE